MFHFILFVGLYLSSLIELTSAGRVRRNSGDFNDRGAGYSSGTANDPLTKYLGHLPWLEWRQLIRRVSAARCTVLSRDASQLGTQWNDTTHSDGVGAQLLREARSLYPDRICHLPIFLLFSKNGCSACTELFSKLGSSVEFELLSEYMTLVYAESIKDLRKTGLYPRPSFFSDSHLNHRKHSLFKQNENDIWKAFALQGEYFPRILFIFPHNGTVMPVFNSGLDSDTDHFHFYREVNSLLKSMLAALRVMNKDIDVSEL
ncbi:hypothetical protein TRVL_06795 [Trypanosoma vivax]|nr:hypothetical protein TRVL_06795 [Trypanosoma vivax]